MKGLTVILAIFVFMIACNNDKVVEPNKNSVGGVIIPLSVGNKWIYQSNYFDLGVLDSNDSDYIDRVFSNITLVKTLYDTVEVTAYENGWYTIKNFLGFDSNYRFKNGNNGFYFINVDSVDARPTLLFKYPILKDEEYAINPNCVVNVATKRYNDVINGKNLSSLMYQITWHKKNQYLISVLDYSANSTFNSCLYITPNYGLVVGGRYIGHFLDLDTHHVYLLRQSLLEFTLK
ncbi:MAG TPA: hypothetical protein PLE30_11170 [Candidatus Kapabacteria bacterium]|nr:hypothetical protein [Candidatus Kapabacteria bacterium]